MTVAVAVKKGDRTVIAADSLVNFGGQRCPPQNCRFHKINEVGSSRIVCAGWSIYTELLMAYCSSKGIPPHLENEAAVFDFFLSFWRSMRSDYTLVGGPRANDDHPFADLDSVFLLANAHGIFRVTGDLDVTFFRQYAAIGSGSKYALGAMGVLYDMLDDPVEIAHRGVQAGIDHDVYCGGAIDMSDIPPAAVHAAREERRTTSTSR